MIKAISLFKNSPYYNAISTLVGGTAISQLINFSLYFIIAKIYTPEDFGLFSLVSVSASIISIIATGRFDLAIMLPKDYLKTKEIYKIGFLITVLVCCTVLLFLLVINIFTKFYFTQFYSSNFKFYFFIPLLIFSQAVIQLTTIYFSKQKQYSTIANSRVSNTALSGTTGVLFGLLKTGALGLIVSTILGSYFALFYLLRKLKSKATKIKWLLDKQFPTKTFLEYKQFPIFNVPQSLLDALQFNILIYLFNFLFSTDVVGQIAFSIRIIQFPVSLIGSSISLVFFQQISEKINSKNQVWPSIKKTIIFSFLIFLPFAISIFFGGNYIFKHIFGAKWEMAGNISIILISWIFLDFIRSPISQLAIVFNLQKQWMYGTFLLNLSVLITILIANYISSEINFVLIAASIIATLGTFLLMFIFILHLKKNNKDL
jgi:O-antigen/teichoic acid export membrane protein